jgi:outer membrane lipoprotein-sorting protein
LPKFQLGRPSGWHRVTSFTEEHRMTRTFHAALAACTLALAGVGAVAPAAAQTGFEGVTTFRTTNKSDGTHGTMVQTTKGNKMRLEGMGGDKNIMVFDGDSHSMMVIDNEKKTYMTITEADMEQMAAMMKPMADRQSTKKDDFHVDLTNTGRTETVAGTKCEVWHGTTTQSNGEKKEGEGCVAKGVGFAFYDIMVNNPMTKRMRSSMQESMAKYKEVMSGGKGVLKMTSIENGKPSVDMEATKIEKQSVSEDAFKPPAGYTGQSMSQMMQGASQQMEMMREKMKAQQQKDKPN